MRLAFLLYPLLFINCKMFTWQYKMKNHCPGHQTHVLLTLPTSTTVMTNLQRMLWTSYPSIQTSHHHHSSNKQTDSTRNPAREWKTRTSKSIAYRQILHTNIQSDLIQSIVISCFNARFHLENGTTDTEHAEHGDTIVFKSSFAY